MNENDMNWIRNKLDKMDERLDNQATTLARLTVSVEDHVQRSNALQAIVVPMKTRMDNVEGIGKAVFFLGAIVGILKAVRFL